ncbi:hypothetical protein LXL04_028280 [Taraxacum kok-saghyz]
MTTWRSSDGVGVGRDGAVRSEEDRRTATVARGAGHRVEIEAPTRSRSKKMEGGEVDRNGERGRTLAAADIFFT